MSEQKVRIANYTSPRSFIIFGETKEVKDDLKKVRAKFNRFLRNPDKPQDTSSKIAAWVISANRVQEAQKQLNISEIEQVNYSIN